MPQRGPNRTQRIKNGAKRRRKRDRVEVGGLNQHWMRRTQFSLHNFASLGPKNPSKNQRLFRHDEAYLVGISVAASISREETIVIENARLFRGTLGLVVRDTERLSLSRARDCHC